MHIFCPNCKRQILDTSPEFVCGGPYFGAMFAPPTGRRAFRSNSFRFRQWATMPGKRLPCPSCGNFLLRRDGGLLTEHGIIKAGQATVDMGFSVIHHEGEAEGYLRTAQEYSRECTTFSGSPEAPNPQDFGPRPEKDTAADDFAAAMAGTDWTGAEDKDQGEDPEAERERLIGVLHAAGKKVHANTGLAKLRANVAKLGGEG
jgi:hypothetical protein